MKTKPQNQEPKKQKQNQLRFIEYEKPTADGHFITIVDSYHNVLGRISKSYNDQSKKYEYVAFDHAGNVMSKGEKVWEAKNVYVNNREQLLEAAHQRRIEMKQNPKEQTTEKQQPAPKSNDRTRQIQNLRDEKNGRGKQPSKAVEEEDNKSSGRTSRGTETSNAHADTETNQQQEREEELEEIRDNDENDRGDTDMDR